MLDIILCADGWWVTDDGMPFEGPFDTEEEAIFAMHETNLK